MISKPNQSVQQAERIPQVIIDEGPQNELFAALHHQSVVKVRPVKQHEYILRAPAVPIGPKRTDIPTDRRLGIGVDAYPQQYARHTYLRGAYKTPPSQQSIPGYVLFNGQLVTQTKGYPRGALKAPKPRTGGGQCE